MTSSNKIWRYFDESAPEAIAGMGYFSNVTGGTPWQSGIISGTNNQNSANQSVIVNGDQNQLLVMANSSVIVSGQLNCLALSFNGVIGNGANNILENSNNSTIVGGSNHCIMFSAGAGIGGGSTNCILSFSDSSVIIGGINNSIFENTLNSTIAGGEANSIGTTGSTTIIEGNIIYGGNNNKIDSGNHNVILGGTQNLLTGNCNAILGGQQNCDNGFNLVGIFGNNVSAVMDGAFHANNYLIKDIGPGFSSFCQLYFDAASFGLNIS